MPYTDDETIEDSTLLLRRIPINPRLHIIWDNNTKSWLPSSAAFENHPNGTPMSVVLEDVLKELGRPLDSALDGHGDGFSLVGFEAGIARSCDQGVAREPVEGEPAHGVVFGNKTRSVRRALARSSVWIVPPDLEVPDE